MVWLLKCDIKWKNIFYALKINNYILLLNILVGVQAILAQQKKVEKWVSYIFFR